MISLMNVLVGTDFSDCSQTALEHGRGLAAQFNVSLHVLHVVTEPLHEVWACYAPGAGFLESVERLELEARKRMEPLTQSAELGTDRVIIATAWGEPSEQILKYARTHRIDLIVCGTHGRRGWDHMVMGSVAERVVRFAPCPVLTVTASVGEIVAAA